MIEGFDINAVIWDVVKIVVLLFLVMYIVFAGVVIKQVSNMNETLDVGLGHIMKFIAMVHFSFAIFVFVLSFLIL